jgi:hypothetical protein
MEQAETSELAPSASLEERVLKNFNLSPEEETEVPQTEEPELPVATESETEVEAQSPFEEVEFDGKVYQVPPEIKNGLMHKADYTRRTQDLAKNRQALELQQQQVNEFFEQQRFEQSLQEEIGKVGTLNYQIQQYQGLDWSKLQTDELIRNRMQLDGLEKKRNELIEALKGKRGSFAEQQKQRVSESLSKANEILQKNIPNWSEAVAAEVSEFALSKGYTQYEVNNVTNPRDVETLWKAMQYEKLVSNKDAALRKAAKAPPVVKPGSVKPMPPDVRDKLNYAKAMKKLSTQGATNADKARLIQRRIEQKLTRK